MVDFKFLTQSNDNRNNTSGFRKNSADNASSNNDFDAIHVYLRVFFLIRKFLMIISNKDPEKYPLEYQNTYKGLKYNEEIDISILYIGNLEYDRINYKGNEVFLADIDEMFILMEIIPEKSNLCTIVGLENWKNLMISPDFSKNLLVVTVKRKKNANFILKGTEYQDLSLLLKKLQQRIQFSLLIEGELIKSFFEDTSGKILGYNIL